MVIPGKPHGKYVLTLSIIILLGGVAFYMIRPVEHAGQTLSAVTINGHEYLVELANTPALQQQGLSDRLLLAPDTGMLFQFTKPGKYSFWMKDMRFSIDMIWIRDGKVVGFVVDAPIGNTIPAIFTPPVEVDMVLEVNAGTVKADGITIGDAVSLKAISEIQ